MTDTTTDVDELDDVVEDDELDEDAAESTADDVDDLDEDEGDEGDDADAEKAFLAKLGPDEVKFYNRRKTQLIKARADAGRQRRKLRRVTSAPSKTDPPKPTPPKRKTTADAPLSKDELLAELRQELETKAQTDRVTGLAERKLESMLSLPSDPDARERKLNRALKMLDLTGCASAADVADAIADLKDDAPELFRRKRATKPKTGGVGGPAKATGAGGKAPDKIGALFED